MLGIATRLSGLQTLRNRLAVSADPTLNSYAQLIDDHPSWANFGAMGPAWGELTPTRQEEVIFGSPGVPGYAALWKRIFNVFGGDGTDANPGLKPILDEIRTLLDQLDTIAADEDLDALMGMESAIGQIGDIAQRLTAVVTAIRGDGTLANTGIVLEIANLISSTNMPGIIRDRPDGTGKGFPAQFWTLREFLSWRRTGRFASKLWTAAETSGRDELRAYALGLDQRLGACDRRIERRGKHYRGTLPQRMVARTLCRQPYRPVVVGSCDGWAGNKALRTVAEPL